MRIGLILKGAAMGMAEVVPGVSGGTIAFITGIYEKLIDNIANFDLKSLKLLLIGDFKSLKNRFDFSFLFSVILGMALGLVSAVFGVTYLKDNFPIQLSALFFGLILGSVFYIYNKIDKHTITQILGLIIMAILSYYVTVMAPIEASGNLLYIFICGTIAISALMLPGISGSLLLLMLGAYYIVLPAVKELLSGHKEGLPIIVVFALGCILGVLTIAKLLKFAFQNFKDLTFSLMTGLMIGSLNKLWPWQNILTMRTNSKGVEVPFQTVSVWYSHFAHGAPCLLSAIVFCIVGVLMVLVLDKIDKC